MCVLFEDDDIVVVDKPALRPVHPSPGHEANSLTEELVRTRPEMATVGSVERPGVVHRLDIDTSGVMVFAKTQRAYKALRAAFESHAGIRKTYLAVTHGVPKTPAGTCTTPIADKGRGRSPSAPHGRGRSPSAPHGRGRSPSAAPAITHWRVLGRVGPLALIEFDIETGRMHQIRIHAAELGCPIVGDALYGDKARDRALKRRAKRTLLHAVCLEFAHPVTRRPLSFTAPPPADIVYPI